MRGPNMHADAARLSRLSAFLDLEAGEARPVASMIGLNFAVSAAFVLVQTSAFGLFIEAFGSHALPYAYFSVAILSSLIAYAFLQVSQRVSFARSLYINLAFLAGMSTVFWLGLRSPQSRWFIFLLPFWFQTLVNLANLVVWHLAGHMFHVRQAKRVFGLIVAGNWIANIVGGVLVASLLGNFVALGSVPSGGHRARAQHACSAYCTRQLPRISGRCSRFRLQEMPGARAPAPRCPTRTPG